MTKSLVSIALLFALFAAQSQENPLSSFDNLLDKTWISEGKWGDGSVFRQETFFTYGLNKQLIIVKSKGFVDAEQTVFGDRNHGIRKYDKESGKVLFWEFDVFGGTTTGEVVIEKNKMLYVYEYDGAVLADVWEYVNDATYTLKVASYQDGELGQVYMQGTIRLKN